MSGVSPTATSQFQQAQLLSQVQTAVAKKGLDVQRQQGDAAVALLEQAAQLQQSQVQRMSVEPFKGASLDVIA